MILDTRAKPREPVIILESWICSQWAMSAIILNTEDYLTSEVCFLCKAKVSSEEKDKGVWKMYSGHSLTDSAFNCSRSVRLRAI